MEGPTSTRYASPALQRKPSAEAQGDAALTEQIAAIRESSRATNGAPWVYFELKEMDQHVSRKRVARLFWMRSTWPRATSLRLSAS